MLPGACKPLVALLASTGGQPGQGSTASDSIPVSLFLHDAAMDMLPIRMWQDLKGRLDVTIAALSGVLIVVKVTAMLLVERLAGLARRIT